MEFLNIFLTNAYAADPASSVSPQGGGLSFMMMFVVFIAFVYFVILRPQSKRAKEQQQLLNSMAKGDEVLTTGGLLGRIMKITDQYIILSLANDVQVVMQKTSVVTILPKGTLKSIE